MVDAARKYNRVVQMGTQQRSAPHYAEAVEYVKSGKLGKIRLVRGLGLPGLDGRHRRSCPTASRPPASTTTCGSARRRSGPFNQNRFHFNFRWYWDYSGGLMTDWGAHMIDIANWAMGVKAPELGRVGRRQVRLSRTTPRRRPTRSRSLWEFPDFSMIWEHAIGDRPRPGSARARRRLPRQQRRARGRPRRLGGATRNRRIDKPREVQDGRRAAAERRAARTTTCSTCRTSSTACAAGSGRARTSRSATTR